MNVELGAFPTVTEGALIKFNAFKKQSQVYINQKHVSYLYGEMTLHPEPTCYSKEC
jgi:hypothetical protein